MLSLVESLNVEAKPEPPWEARVVVSGERESALRIAGSIFGAIFSRGMVLLGSQRIEQKEDFIDTKIED